MTDWRDRTKVVYCTRCVVSNQRPRIAFDERGVCSACQHADRKRSTDWAKREADLRAICGRHRRSDGRFDVIVPSSGGKDSSFVAHQLKHVYGMHPLTATWAPNLWTPIGWSNLQHLIDAGFHNVLGRPDGNVNRKLVRLAFERMGDPFQPFIYGVKSFPIRVAIQYGIPLIMYAEDGEVEYGGESKNAESGTIDIAKDLTRTYFSGIAPEDWMAYGISRSDLEPYLMPTLAEIDAAKPEYRYMAHYKKWVPQENYYYAAEHVGFQANPVRSEGTYSKYASLDDRIDGIHYYLMFIKFGIGRATSDAAHEVRDGHISREEAVSLVRRYDGEFPQKSYEAFLEYTGMTADEFHAVVDKFRSPHIWGNIKGEWVLRSQVT